jgi:predicted HTH transcriptional regulator
VDNSGVNGVNSGVDGVNGVNNLETLSENEKLVLGQLNVDNDISIVKLMEMTGLARRTIDRIIKALKDKGYIKRNGTAKSGSWEILK